MHTGCWNVNRWIFGQTSDNFYLRKTCLEFLNLDIVDIFHFTDNSVQIHGYKWFGYNRHSISVNARSSSGGIWF